MDTLAVRVLKVENVKDWSWEQGSVQAVGQYVLAVESLLRI